MSSIKRHNHRIHPCESSRKQDLLKHLTSLYADKSILIVSSDNTGTTEIKDKNITLTNDAELAKMDKREWDVLINFDIPKIAEDYLVRLSYAKEMALILVDEKEQVLLYAIEKLLGKNIKQELVKGFEPKIGAKDTFQKHKPTKSQLLNAGEDAKRKSNEIDKEKIFSAKKDFSAKKSWDKKATVPGQRKPKVFKIPAKKK